MVKCLKCNKKVKDLPDHVRNIHMHRLSKQSYEYLKSLQIENLGEKLAGLGIREVEGGD